MLFEKNHKMFNAFPINKFRYNLEVNESCYAVRFVFNDNDEYIIKKYQTLSQAKTKCEQFTKKFKVPVGTIKVTRVSDSEYEYEACWRNMKKDHVGKLNGTFTQVPVTKIDEFTVRGRNHYFSIPNGRECPDDFTIGASYLADECVKDNPIVDDEFVIGASYASSDFYEHHIKGVLSR